MSLIDQLNLQVLKQAYMFASTPRYLFRRFRDDETVATLNEKFSISELMAEYKQLSVDYQNSAEKLVGLYAILVAITLREYRVAKQAFRVLDLDILDWGKEIEKINDINHGRENYFTFGALNVQQVQEYSVQASPLGFRSPTPTSQVRFRQKDVPTIGKKRLVEASESRNRYFVMSA